ncbi:E3 ubiquitin-protein ligase RMA1H1-like [Diospyros lotus]|uniref:E3 ubiquitin-protein ligase RMA1H1-like n=1 Tax=Diospyros lotus TaxID=55363 RepID=UPI002253578B|nr:E3 ubiquitin-protein ligase RMA1H1-like [Diospyros lotus]
MACEKYLAKEWKSISAAQAEPENISGCFDCNICLDSAHDPVVTLCGHLYCWPCIYKWLDFQAASLDSDKYPQCPVCKSEISHTTVVPLYGQGHTPNGAELRNKAPSLNLAIPPRPPACGTQALIAASELTQQLQYHNPYQNRQHSPDPIDGFGEYSSLETSGHSSPTAMGAFPPTAGGLGEMLYARGFGHPESLYIHPNSYHQAGSSSPRLRREEMQAMKSLKRILIFLYFCLILSVFFL